MASRLWLEVNTGTGDIYANLRTSKDASGLPTHAGGTWVEVQESEFSLASGGERPSWVDANPAGSRVVENPYPRLRFTPASVEADVGDTPPNVTIQVVNRNGDPLTPSGDYRLFVGGSVQKLIKVTLVSGTTTVAIPTSESRVIIVRAQPERGFLVEAPLVALVASTTL